MKGTVETAAGKFCLKKGPENEGLSGPVLSGKRGDQPGRFIWQLVGVLDT